MNASKNAEVSHHVSVVECSFWKIIRNFILENAFVLVENSSTKTACPERNEAPADISEFYVVQFNGIFFMLEIYFVVQ